MLGSGEVLVVWLLYTAIALWILYWVIRLAVRHALRDHARGDRAAASRTDQ